MLKIKKEEMTRMSDNRCENYRGKTIWDIVEEKVEIIEKKAKEIAVTGLFRLFILSCNVVQCIFPPNPQKN